MVKRRTQGAPEPAALLLAIPPEEAATKIDDRIKKGEELKLRRITQEQELEEARGAYKMWTDYNAELLRRLFTTTQIAEEYSDWWGIVAAGRPNLNEKIRDLHGDIDTKIQRLRSVRGRLELIPVVSSGGTSSRRSGAASSRRVFVVHGHDEAARESVARFIEKLGLEPIILHEKPSGGRTIIEKLEHHAVVGFAVVLLTPDDIGAAAVTPGDLNPRARQNVVLELGYFVGCLGRSKVCALHKGPLELPSDMLGIVYVPLDGGGAWRLHLAKELREVGFTFDLNAAI